VAVEISILPSGAAAPAELQWGHGHVAVEIAYHLSYSVFNDL
jgi:hypothetical protein